MPPEIEYIPSQPLLSAHRDPQLKALLHHLERECWRCGRPLADERLPKRYPKRDPTSIDRKFISMFVHLPVGKPRVPPGPTCS